MPSFNILQIRQYQPFKMALKFAFFFNLQQSPLFYLLQKTPTHLFLTCLFSESCCYHVIQEMKTISSLPTVVFIQPHFQYQDSQKV